MITTLHASKRVVFSAETTSWTRESLKYKFGLFMCFSKSDAEVAAFMISTCAVVTKLLR